MTVSRTALALYSNLAMASGTTTNDDAAVGIVGEVVTATVAAASAVDLTVSTTAYNVTSISLTAGDWNVMGVVDFVLTGITATVFKCGVSLTTATLPTQPGGSGLGTDALAQIPLLTTALSSTHQQAIPTTRLSIAATTTVYLVASTTFSLGTLKAYGSLTARRAR